MALPLYKYWFFKIFSSLMSYNLTVEHNHFHTILHYSFFSFRVAKVTQGFLYSYSSHTSLFSSSKFHFFFFKCHQLYDKINYQIEKVISNWVLSIHHIWKTATISHPSPLLWMLHCLNGHCWGTAAPVTGSRLWHGHRSGKSDPATTLDALVGSNLKWEI